MQLAQQTQSRRVLHGTRGLKHCSVWRLRKVHRSRVLHGTRGLKPLNTVGGVVRGKRRVLHGTRGLKRARRYRHVTA